jgi:hypothetical protein
MRHNTVLVWTQSYEQNDDWFDDSGADFSSDT